MKQTSLTTLENSAVLVQIAELHVVRIVQGESVVEKLDGIGPLAVALASQDHGYKRLASECRASDHAVLREP